MGMPRRHEQQASAPSDLGQARPDTGDEQSGAEQSPAIRNKEDVPDGCLEVSGGWVPYEPPPSLMDLCADGEIPEPSAAAKARTGLASGERGPTATYKTLIATAMTMLEDGGYEGMEAHWTMAHLENACRRGVDLMRDRGPSQSCLQKVRDKLPVVRRPNEARRFA